MTPKFSELNAVAMKQAGEIWRVADDCGYFELDTSVDGETKESLVERIIILESVKPVPMTTRALAFCVRWRREMCLAGMAYRMELAESSLDSESDKSSGNQGRI